MDVQSFPCPSCGANLEVANRFAKTVICNYCSQACHASTSGLLAAGSSVRLVDYPSILKVGKKGYLKGNPFTVAGRLRFQYESGFWDEWFLQSAGDAIWLQEDEGEFVMFRKETITAALPTYEKIVVGSVVTLHGSVQAFVTGKGEAVISGGEGEIPFTVYPGEGLYYVDAVADGKLYSIEYSHNEIALFTGEAIATSQIGFS